MDQTSSELESNYTVTNGINVNQALLSSDGKKVILSTSVHQTNTLYTVTVNNVTDIAGNVISSDANSAQYQNIDTIINPGLSDLLIYQALTSAWYMNYTPDKSIDGQGYQNPDSRWAGLIPMPDTITYDLGSAYSIGKTKFSFYRWDQGRIYHYSIFASLDGISWTTILANVSSSSQEWSTNEFPLTEARYVRLISLDNNESVYAGVYEAEIWGKQSIVSDSDDKIVVNQFKLNQNYPNPFNPQTKIVVEVPYQTSLKLKVYDVLGKLVRELANGQFTQGVYEFTFDGSNLSSGIYLYRIESNSFNETKKMILTK